MEKIKHDSILESFSILNFNEQNLNKKMFKYKMFYFYFNQYNNMFIYCNNNTFNLIFKIIQKSKK